LHMAEGQQRIAIPLACGAVGQRVPFSFASFSFGQAKENEGSSWADISIHSIHFIIHGYNTQNRNIIFFPLKFSMTCVNHPHNPHPVFPLIL
jgi:hypothetical protein